MDCSHAFLATARIDGAALLVTGEPGGGKTVLLDAASEEASAAGMAILRAAGVQFEADTSFSGLNQVLLSLLGALPLLPAVHHGHSCRTGPSAGTSMSLSQARCCRACRPSRRARVRPSGAAPADLIS